ncbi:C39 family peptidase [Ornithinibacillus xuwenensis]|uniref:C39 family peptidase n=1 Tax=Ornithinibacillus xuwenensis TaxID=3144668 RepID=A0ABU9XJW8_9BACI
MKLILRNSFLLFLLFATVIILTTQGDRIYAFIYELFDKDEGRLTIISVDAQNGYPIVNSKFQLIDVESNEVMQEISTDSDGLVESDALPLDSSVKIVQIDVEEPYQLNTESQIIEMKSEKETIKIENEIHSSITAFKRTEDKRIIPIEMNLPVDVNLQNPELPNGCEVTALASVLQYYGYDADKKVLATKYLPKVSFEVIDGKLYGANPNEAYAGDPSSENQGFFSYAPPIAETVNQYMKAVNGNHQPDDISGSNAEELLDYIKQGVPVIVWITIDLKDPLLNYSWYLNETDKRIEVPRNSHTVVLTGFSDNEVYVMDPLKGNVTYPKETFFDIYKKAGSHALLIR